MKCHVSPLKSYFAEKRRVKTQLAASEDTLNLCSHGCNECIKYKSVSLLLGCSKLFSFAWGASYHLVIVNAVLAFI